MQMPKLRFLSLLLYRMAMVSVIAAPELGHSAPSQFGISRDGKLDQPAIARAYKESDWDQVTGALEGYLRRHGDSKVSPEERIFAYKYLGVIYAADSLSRSKAESYFTRLLNLSPKVEILDLFASKKVNELFDQMKFDHDRRSKYSQQFDSYGRESNPSLSSMGQPSPTSFDQSPLDSIPTIAIHTRLPQPVPVRPTRESSLKTKSKAWVWWTVGIAAAAGAGAGIYYLSSQDTGPKVSKEPQIEIK